MIQQLTARHADRLAAYPVGQGRRPQRLKPGGDALRPRLRRDELQHLLRTRRGQTLSYKFGSLSHADAATRRQAIEHNLECIEIGQALGSKALTVWIGDGSNFPGQSNFTKAFERYLDFDEARSMSALPKDWRLFSEHKIYEPAFYSTVVQDWGTNYMIATELGEKAYCLVDLGHHAPNVNIEMIVARLIQFGKLGGFHFNDSKYGDDDLDAAPSIPSACSSSSTSWSMPSCRGAESFHPAHMIDQSHNVTDPIESLMPSAPTRSGAPMPRRCSSTARPSKATRTHNDALMASRDPEGRLPHRCRADPGQARLEAGGAIDPIAAYRASGYRAAVAERAPRSGWRQRRHRLT